MVAQGWVCQVMVVAGPAAHGGASGAWQLAVPAVADVPVGGLGVLGLGRSPQPPLKEHSADPPKWCAFQSHAGRSAQASSLVVAVS